MNETTFSYVMLAIFSLLSGIGLGISALSLKMWATMVQNRFTPTTKQAISINLAILISAVIFGFIPGIFQDTFPQNSRYIGPTIVLCTLAFLGVYYYIMLRLFKSGFVGPTLLLALYALISSGVIGASGITGIVIVALFNLPISYLL